MRCEVTSREASNVLLSRELIVPTYKHVCRGEKKKVNLGYNNIETLFKVENNTLIPYQRLLKEKGPIISQNWEVLSKFFIIHNVVPIWHNCHSNWGHQEAGRWTGCMGKVRKAIKVEKVY